MIKIEKQINVKKVIITEEDVDSFRYVCKTVEEHAEAIQASISKQEYPPINYILSVQNAVSFCRRFFQECGF